MYIEYSQLVPQPEIDDAVQNGDTEHHKSSATALLQYLNRERLTAQRTSPTPERPIRRNPDYGPSDLPEEDSRAYRISLRAYLRTFRG